MEEKDIDRLFQEKLKDIEVAPNPRVWNAIETKLQKKKRRIIPIWWFYSGAVAVFVLGFFLFFNNSKEQLKNNFPVLTKEVIEKNKAIDNKESLKKVIEYKAPVLTTDVVERKDKEINNKPFKERVKQKSAIVIAANKRVSKEVRDKKIVKESDFENKIKNKRNYSVIIATNGTKEGGFRGITPSFNRIPFFIDTSFIRKVLKSDSIKTTERGESKVSEEVSKKDLLSSDFFSKEALKKKDLITEIVKEEGFLKAKEEVAHQWTISPVVGVLQSNSFSQASALSEDLNTNDFTGENTISYGVNVTYKLNNKWALKSGVQIQRSSFRTSKVSFFGAGSVVASSLENVVIDSNLTLVEDIITLDNTVVTPSLDTPVEFESSENGSLSQSYGYIEIPLEVRYTFFSTKNVETSIITGFSSLILNENTITSETESGINKIGEVSNLNTLNFSGNLGFDIDIKLSEKVNLNINPIFKTQLNTFSNDANGFKPYNIGVYTGIKYKF